MKKIITKMVEVEQRATVTKTFPVEMKVDWKYEEALKKEKLTEDEYSEHEYICDNFGDDIEEKAREMMDNCDLKIEDFDWEKQDDRDIEIDILED